MSKLQYDINKRDDGFFYAVETKIGDPGYLQSWRFQTMQSAQSWIDRLQAVVSSYSLESQNYISHQEACDAAIDRLKKVVIKD